MRFQAFFSFSLCLLLIALSGCNTSQSHIGTSESSDDALRNQDLTTRLKSYPGIRVNGSGASAEILSRGVNSFVDNEPLYILNNNQVPSYPDLYSMVNTRDIKRIEVLVRPEDTGIYGHRGSNGVIKVTTAAKSGGYTGKL